jgi:predicted PurR-regulated permease PerM
MLKPPQSRRAVEFTVSWATLLKITFFSALVFAIVKLIPLFGMLFIALLIAMTMAPLVSFVTRRGGPKWLGIALCSVLLFGSVGLFFFVVTPEAAWQISGLIKTLPSFKDHILQQLPKTGSTRDIAEGFLRSSSFSNPEPLLQKFMSWGAIALQSMVEFFVVLVIAIYLLADGKRVFEWMVAFLPHRQRQRVDLAAPEIFSVVFSYMRGQFLTSIFCGIFMGTVLALLHVPNALLLAIISGILDVLPIIGFFLSLAPALVMALSVSPFAACAVFVLYLLYHLAETYFIVPSVYGNRLRLSTLTVLVSCLAAGMLGGVVGVIAILPIVASFPICERIWLRPFLGHETVDKHDEIEEKEHPSR